ncbi:MAG: penicillin-binding transpeptidase domain-containing protein [Prolixibacteraceae bacterium]|nr:penicillin-binding transpeptidase domain-containing protein [Prolixibacteraceae bacterium]NLO02712.1 penicillin-binding protein 2 [Bacteroidales bacterium]
MDTFSKRNYIIIGIFILTGLVFVIRLFSIQILDPVYKVYATNNVLREVVQYPARGLIYDRNDNLLVYNKPAYDLMITPREMADFDTMYLCNLLDVSKDEIIRNIELAKDYSYYKPSVLVKQIPPETYAILQELIYKYNGFHTQSRTLREYVYSAAAHLLGYVGEVSREDMDRESYYSMGDYIGQSGIEKTYESWLRGKKGINKYLVDVHNRIKTSFLDGEENIPPVTGSNLTSTLDIDLQLYAETLLQNKRGSVVAIEPSTGEILALASAPAYHPGLLAGRIRSRNYSMLLSDTLKPLFNRALQAEYPPGSTFKVLNVLVGLQVGAIGTDTYFSCSGPASYPIRCTHDHVSPLNAVQAIRESCNPFMWNTFRSILYKYETSAEGYNIWRDHVMNFGIGRRLGIDINGESAGSLPNESYYNNIYGKGHWNAMTVRSLAIGQGELGITPLQLANYAAAVANRGYYYPPHVIKSIDMGEIDNTFRIRKYVGISTEYFEPAVQGMEDAVRPGALSHIPGIAVCGKTGTAENPHGSDHSVFMAFAPKDDPMIAISVYIENGVWGARYAAPIASLIIEKYLTDSISDNRKWLESRMIEANLLNPYQPK